LPFAYIFDAPPFLSFELPLSPPLRFFIDITLPPCHCRFSPMLMHYCAIFFFSFLVYWLLPFTGFIAITEYFSVFFLRPFSSA
jgi:hypothetical protein